MKPQESVAWWSEVWSLVAFPGRRHCYPGCSPALLPYGAYGEEQLWCRLPSMISASLITVLQQRCQVIVELSANTLHLLRWMSQAFRHNDRKFSNMSAFNKHLCPNFVFLGDQSCWSGGRVNPNDPILIFPFKDLICKHRHILNCQGLEH